MRWFFRWLSNKIEDAEYNIPKAMPESLYERQELESTEHITFKLYRGSGGWVVQVKKFDEKSQEIISTLHVVHFDENLGEALSKILTFEIL